MIEAILNQDGTVCNPPKNPLKEKWEASYPPCQDNFDYHCMFCDKCHYGDYWKVPEEDKKIWGEYVKEYTEYMREHNPSSCLYI